MGFWSDLGEIVEEILDDVATTVDELVEEIMSEAKRLFAEITDWLGASLKSLIEKVTGFVSAFLARVQAKGLLHGGVVFIFGNVVRYFSAKRYGDIIGGIPTPHKLDPAALGRQVLKDLEKARATVTERITSLSPKERQQTAQEPLVHYLDD